jgi:DnaJ-class molecular chaperone
MEETIMALALLANLDESQLKDMESEGKLCSTCDPDMPGHAERSSCPACKGKGIELCSFFSTATEIAESKLSNEPQVWGKRKGKGKLKNDECQEGEDDDSLYLEY